MKTIIKTALFLTIPLFTANSLYALQTPLAESSYFEHKDWEMACDNTHTCRVAGYHADDETDHLVSILLTRNAGANTTIDNELILDILNEETGDSQTLNLNKITMWINQKNLGHVKTNKNNKLTLNPTQLNSLLNALKQNSSIKWTLDSHTWKLSDQGAAAVLLKMDAYQKRIGTPSAIIRTGNRPATQVQQPASAPRITIPRLIAPSAADQQLIAQHQSDILKALKQTIKEDDHCTTLSDTENTAQAKPIELVQRLNAKQLLVSTPCWMAAYNAGDGYWVINQQAPYNATLITNSGNDYDKGIISATHKSRGIGDCWGSTSWAWNGQSFVKHEEFTTGQCKGMAGGFWKLSTYTSIVVNQNDKP